MSGAVRSNQILETARRVHDEVIPYQLGGRIYVFNL